MGEDGIVGDVELVIVAGTTEAKTNFPDPVAVVIITTDADVRIALNKTANTTTSRLLSPGQVLNIEYKTNTVRFISTLAPAGAPNVFVTGGTK